MFGTLTFEGLEMAWQYMKPQPKRYLIGRAFELSCMDKLLEVMSEPGAPLANQFIWKESSFASPGKVYMMTMHGDMFSKEAGDKIYCFENVSAFTNPDVLETIKKAHKN